MNDDVKLTKQFLENVLDAMGIEHEISLELLAEEPALQVETPEQARLIGRGGENLRALQYLVHQLVKRQSPSAPMVTIDVAGYRRSRLRKLEAMVGVAKSQALNSDEPIELAPMNAYERRYIHSLIAEEPALSSESSGQEPARHVVIRKTG